MPLPYPHVFVPDVTHITPALLKKRGVAGLLLDIDGTLMQTRDAMPARPVLDWMQRMKAEGCEELAFGAGAARFSAVEGHGFQLVFC